MWKNYFLKKIINIVLKSNVDFDALMRSIEESDSGYSKLITHITKNSDVLMKIGDRILESETIFSMFARYISNKGSDEKCQYKVSYAQSGEDLIIDFVFKTMGINKPSYIDIGAYHPYLFSNTALFYSQGCRGVNIEPNKFLYELFLKERSEDLNLNIGISDKTEELVFYVMEPPTLSSFSKDISEAYVKEHNHRVKETIKVKTETLENIVTRYCNNIFPDFMSLDAEGIDDLIIKSIDYGNNSPKVICLESITYSTTGDGIKNYETIQYLEARGYMVYADTYINTIFVKKNLWNKK